MLAALRLGAFQLAFLDGVAAHAAVGESVELAKAEAPRGAGLVNAVLRRAAREGRALVEALPDATPAEAALRHSYPPWIAELWFEALGPEAARALMAAGNRPAEAALRANTLRTTAAELAARAARREPARRRAPGGARARGRRSTRSARRCGSRELFMPQSRAAMAVAPDPRPAARGARARPVRRAGRQDHPPRRADGGPRRRRGGRAPPGRAEALARTAARMGARQRRGAHGRRRRSRRSAEAYDRVLVDPPCSDLGTLAARPDARWRKQAVAARPRSRSCRARSCAPAPTRCARAGRSSTPPARSPRPRTRASCERFLAERPDFAADDLRSSEWSLWQHGTRPMFLQTLPHRDGTDGFFVARLRRAEGS